MAPQLYWTYRVQFEEHLRVAHSVVRGLSAGRRGGLRRALLVRQSFGVLSVEVSRGLLGCPSAIGRGGCLAQYGRWGPHPRLANRPAGAPFVTLYFHGNAGNITDRYDHFREITSAGSSVLMIDYRGYGKSAGQPSENGIYRDADAAYDHLLKTGQSPRQIIVHGESLGTAVAVDLASRRPCAAVVLEAPFTSGKDVASTVLPVIGPLVIWSFNSRKKIARVHAPILIIHGDRDEVIPTRLGHALFAAAPEPKSIWIVPGAHHNDIVETAGASYRQRLQSFYETLAPHR